MEHGALSVIMDGITMMHAWSADSWDFPQLVRLALIMNHADIMMCWIDTFTGALARSYAYYGQGSGLIMLTYVACTGEEQNLLNCTQSGYYGVTSCRHNEDAGVRCPGKPSVFS